MVQMFFLEKKRLLVWNGMDFVDDIQPWEGDPHMLCHTVYCWLLLILRRLVHRILREGNIL